MGKKCKDRERNKQAKEWRKTHPLFSNHCLGCVHQEDCRTDKEKAEDYEAILEDCSEEEKKWEDYYNKPFTINIPAKLYEKLTWEKNHQLDYDIYHDRLENLFNKIYNQLEKKYSKSVSNYAILTRARNLIYNVELRLVKEGNDDFLKMIEFHDGDLV